jgi:siroheme synthase
MQRADVAVHDRRIGSQISTCCAAMPNASKSTACPREINELLAGLAEAGKRVVRLKDGDPFVFGRGGEELSFLRRRGVATEAVPGITAALGCAASVGLSLTHRDYAQAVTLIAGEGEDGLPQIDWAGIAGPRQTLAIYMGVGAAGRIARSLLESGLGAETPVAVVENGTLPDQRGVVGRLALRAPGKGIKGQAIIFVGEAAGRLATSTAGAASPLALAS